MNYISWFNKISVGSYVRLIEGWQKFFPNNPIKTRRYVKVEDIVKDDSSMSGILLTIIDDNDNRLTLDASWFTGEVQDVNDARSIVVDIMLFLVTSHKKRRPSSIWVEDEDNTMSAYVRLSIRSLPNDPDTLVVCYDLANLRQKQNSREKGALRAILGAMEYVAKANTAIVYIENVRSPLLKEVLIRYGYSIIDRTEPVSFYLDPSKKTTVAYDYFVSR